MRSTLALVVALGMAAPSGADIPQVSNPKARVRPMQQRVEALLATGMARSETFRHLVRRIEASDVIVYIEARRDLRAGIGASMTFVATSATDRFLRIQLDARHTPNMLVALLGHELQHVVEVVDEATVRSADDLRAFYRTSGVRTGPDSYDSVAARDAGYRVRAEIRHSPGTDLRLASNEQTADIALLDGHAIVVDAPAVPGTH
jgi:hypothetical protein